MAKNSTAMAGKHPSLLVYSIQSYISFSRLATVPPCAQSYSRVKTTPSSLDFSVAGKVKSVASNVSVVDVANEITPLVNVSDGTR